MTRHLRRKRPMQLLRSRYVGMFQMPGAPGWLLAATIEVPVQVIWGDRDVALDAGPAEAGLRLCRQGASVHLPQASHWRHHEEPARVAALTSISCAGWLPPGVDGGGGEPRLGKAA
jgi:pimeloyl-ACP methyl ester carboxylesterase